MRTRRSTPGTAGSSSARTLPGTSVHVEVEDTGVGMSAEAQQHVFERFYRGAGSGCGGVRPRSRDRAPGGAQSRRPGRARVDAGRRDASCGSCSSGHACARRCWRDLGSSVLVVDDDPGVLDVVSFMLRREGFEVDEERMGRRRLQRRATSDYDIVILDVMLPGDVGDRRLPRAALGERRADPDADRTRRGDRPRARPRARRRRLRDEAVLDGGAASAACARSCDAASSIARPAAA